MHWYVYAIIAGVAAPWIILGKSLRNTFKEGGVVTGLSVWAGMSVFTTLVALLIGWIAAKLIG
ncbi:hypothetical protein [Methylocystis echinoides]|jgi:hypothetical protein|uniref:hypothetical protein n=1 Tax=Methylocystis echinoides TaxID=29468 RepID=UPI0034270087